MHEGSEREACANCGRHEGTPFAVTYQDWITARLCTVCRRSLEGLPCRATNRTSERLPTLLLLPQRDGDRAEPLFTMSWEIFGLMFPKIASDFVETARGSKTIREFLEDVKA